jgi:hypothetical protein
VKYYRLSDQNWGRVLESEYDVAFFASGYERRCTYIPHQLHKAKINKAIVLGFSELHMDSQREKNDEYYKKYWKQAPITISANDEGQLYKIFNQLDISKKQSVKILVDYSSMSRLWYAGILNWARYANIKNIEVDFAYSVGDHQEEVYPMVINDILAIPGCEGGSTNFSKSVAIFGLGFDGLSALCVLDKLEPDIIYAFLASPAAFPDYPEKARTYNKELIRHAIKTIELPLISVERTFSYLAELAIPYLSEADITLVPMGPKPHILACILLSIHFREISCLRVSGKRDRPEIVDTTGDVVFTSVEFKPE